MNDIIYTVRNKKSGMLYYNTNDIRKCKTFLTLFHAQKLLNNNGMSNNTDWELVKIQLKIIK